MTATFSFEVFTFEDGKYELHRSGGDRIEVFRNGEPWPAAQEALVGDKLFNAALNHIKDLRALLDRAGSFLEGFEDDPQQEGVVEMLYEIREEVANG